MSVNRRTRRSPDQIIVQLREADTMLSAGQSIAQVCQKLGAGEIKRGSERGHSYISPFSTSAYHPEKCVAVAWLIQEAATA
jgi:hypothetical protein